MENKSRGFIRRKVMAGTPYYQIVRSVRDPATKQPRTMHIASLGQEPTVAGAIKRLRARLANLRPGEDRAEAYIRRRLAELEPYEDLCHADADTKAREAPSTPPTTTATTKPRTRATGTKRTRPRPSVESAPKPASSKALGEATKIAISRINIDRHADALDPAEVDRTFHKLATTGQSKPAHVYLVGTRAYAAGADDALLVRAASEAGWRTLRCVLVRDPG